MSHTPGPWRWGHWVHRPDKPVVLVPPNLHYPNYEFKDDFASMDDGLELSDCEYGTVVGLDEIHGHAIIRSISCGDGGESDIVVGAADARLIAAAPKLLKYAKAVMEDLEKHGPKIVPHLVDTDDNVGEFLRQAIREAEGKDA